jgi:Flp pilus assembly protein TadG
MLDYAPDPMLQKRPLLRRLLAPAIRRSGGFRRDEDAAVAVEFGLLALPFFTIILAILETSLVLFAGQILESAVQDSSRLIRTGQAQNAGFDVEGYRSAICAGLYGMFDCTPGNDKLRVRVTEVADFASATVSPPIDPACSPGSSSDDCDWTIVEAFQPGIGSSTVLVQAYYKWPTIVNLPWFNLANQAGDTRLLSGVRVFRNEPF